MSILRKSVEFVKVKEYEPGQSGRAAVPAKEGYWTYKTVTRRVYTGEASALAPPPYNPFPAPAANETVASPEEQGVAPLSGDQQIKKLEWHILRQNAPKISPTLQEIMEDIEDAQENGYDEAAEGTSVKEIYDGLWDSYWEETERILNAEVATGTLGRVLFTLPWTFGDNAYCAAWDKLDGGGVWFYSFQGFDPDDRPMLKVMEQ